VGHLEKIEMYERVVFGRLKRLSLFHIQPTYRSDTATGKHHAVHVAVELMD
jgi:hypothetical protein